MMIKAEVILRCH